MSSMTKDEVNVTLFDECKRLQDKVRQLEAEAKLWKDSHDAASRAAYKKRCELEAQLKATEDNEQVLSDANKPLLKRIAELEGALTSQNDRSMSVCSHLSISGLTKGMNRIYCASCNNEYWVPSKALGDEG